MLVLKTKRPSTLTGRNVRLPNLVISSCYIKVTVYLWLYSCYVCLCSGNKIFPEIVLLIVAAMTVSLQLFTRQ